ncbi:MAG: 3-dehydroquinate synthase II [Thermoplasmata archaeon]|nr:3-dehydroquinate synthase II [Thermoplasmata archaeon]
MSTNRIVIVLSGRDRRERALVLDRSRRRGFRCFAANRPSESVPRPGETWFALNASGIRDVRASRGSTKRVPIHSIANPADLDAVLRHSRIGEIVAVRWKGERIIPLENLIAGRGSAGEIWVLARGVVELPGALGALEHGAHRVFVELRQVEDVDALEGDLALAPGLDLRWSSAVVTRVRPGGHAERILVDTSSLLRPEEGLLVGSSASLLFHVASEAVGSRYTRPRPFRVNAGAPHSYVLMADGTTRYLAELEVGDPILITTPGGSQRAARVGRLKIETRPMIVLEARTRSRSGTLFLQEAETVRVSALRRRVASTEVRVGMRVRVVELPPGRHLGTVIDESVVER